MRPSEMNTQSLLEGLNRKELSAEEVIKDHLAQLDRWEPTLGAVLTRCDEEAIERAKEIDKKRSKGEPVGVLAGIPIGVKDAISTRGIRTTCGSAMLKDYVAPYDAAVIERLRQADAITLCKLNMDEFAMGSSNENSAFFPCKNPWDLQRVPGGSSGGSAAAVAAGIVPLALGSDTGGSIRQPASLCGVVGLKPTYGRVSRYGLVAYASSLDQIGPMSRNVLDCAMLLQVIAGYDPRDATSTPRGVPGYLHSLEGANKAVVGKTIGLPKEYFVGDGISAEVIEKVQAAIRVFEELGAKVKEISLPHTQYALPTYYLLATAEASSNLARYDGVRFGHRAAKTENLIDMYEKSRAEGFGNEVKRRIMLGTYALSAGYYDAYYKKAQEVRTLIRRDFETAFKEVDVIATPTSPTTAFRLGDKTADPLSMYLADIFTLPCNLAGLPGLALPCGVDGQNLPIGLQLLGKHFDEETLFSFGFAYERTAGLPDRIAPRPEIREASVQESA